MTAAKTHVSDWCQICRGRVITKGAVNVNDMKLTKPNDIAEGFNTFFSNIGPYLAKEIGTAECHFKDYLDKTNSEFTAFQSITVNRVCQLLCELPRSKATGLDTILGKIIKLAAPIISDSLTYIFNQEIIPYARFRTSGRLQE